MPKFSVIALTTFVVTALLSFTHLQAQGGEYLLVYRTNDGIYAVDSSKTSQLLYSDATVIQHKFSKLTNDVLFQDTQGVWSSDVLDWRPNLLIEAERNRTVSITWLPNNHALINVHVFAQRLEDVNNIEASYLYDPVLDVLQEWEYDLCDAMAQADNGNFYIVCRNANMESSTEIHTVALSIDGSYEPFNANSYDIIIEEGTDLLQSLWREIDGEQVFLVMQFGNNSGPQLIEMRSTGLSHSINMVNMPRDNRLSGAEQLDLVAYISRCGVSPLENCVVLLDISTTEAIVEDRLSLPSIDVIQWSVSGNFVGLIGYEEWPGPYVMQVLSVRDNEVVTFDLIDAISGNVKIIEVQ